MLFVILCLNVYAYLLCPIGLAAGLGVGALAEVTRRGLGINKDGSM